MKALPVAAVLAVSILALSNLSAFGTEQEGEKKGGEKCETTEVCFDEWLKFIFNGKESGTGAGWCVKIKTCRDAS